MDRRITEYNNTHLYFVEANEHKASLGSDTTDMRITNNLGDTSWQLLSTDQKQKYKVESSNHSKNGASPKSLMSRTK
jgi:hypothetical protein